MSRRSLVYAKQSFNELTILQEWHPDADILNIFIISIDQLFDTLIYDDDVVENPQHET